MPHSGPFGSGALAPKQRNPGITSRIAAPDSRQRLAGVVPHRHLRRHCRRQAPLCSSSASPAVLGDGAPYPATEQRKGLLEAWRQWWDLEAVAPPSSAAAGEGEPPPLQDMRSILRKVGALLAPDAALLAAASVFLVLAAGSELAMPHFITAAVFSAAKDRSEEAFRRNLALLLASTAAYAGFAALRGWLFSLVNTNLLQRLRAQLFLRLISQPVAFFDATDTAQLTSRLAADCSVISRLFATSINVALRNSLQVVGGTLYLWRLSPAMTAATAGVAAALVVAAAAYGAFTRRAQRIYQDSLAASNGVAEERFSLSRLVRAFGTEGEAAARYDGSLRTLRHISIRQGVAYALYVASNNFLYNATRVATLAVGGAAAVAGAVSAEQLTAFMFYTEYLAAALLSVCDQWGPIMEAVGASERVLAYLDSPPAPQLSPGRVPEGDGRSGGSNGNGKGASKGWELELRDVHFSYPSRPDTKALDGVSLRIPAGRLTALVGLSGSGKSTLVALVQRLYDPAAGAVLLDGADLRELDAGWYRRHVGVVSQDPRLFSMTVAENIAYGCPDASRADVERAAQLANADGFIAALPAGYDTPVTDRLLSGGQRQRIAIARALVRDPRLLVLDEATSALDAESEAAVQSALDRAMRADGRTVIVIAHRLSTVRHADQTVVMDRGRVAEAGTHAQLMRRGGIYAALVRRQAGAVLDQDRDLAPHERQQGEDGGGSASCDGAQPSPAAAAAAGAQQDDSLAQWKQQPRVKDADEDAA